MKMPSIGTNDSSSEGTYQAWLNCGVVVAAALGYIAYDFLASSLTKCVENTYDSLNPEETNDDGATPDAKVIVFSGGTAVNTIVSEVSQKFRRVTYVLPVSDNGGSTREIMDTFGGLAIGDIRSRLVRLAGDDSDHKRTVKAFLGHRLTTESRLSAIQEFQSVLDETHPLWKNIPIVSRDKDYVDKQVIRSFLQEFWNSLLSKTHNLQIPFNALGKFFDFRGASIGNIVLTGARLYFKSLDAAIYWFRDLASVPNDMKVLPIIEGDEDFITIAAKLRNGEVITGQDDISHPPPEEGDKNGGNGTADDDDEDDEEFRQVDKIGSGMKPLQSAIDSVFYINQDGRKIHPKLHSTVQSEISSAEAIVYGMGSLFTSIVPSLIVRGVGDLIVANNGPKILILNSTMDRETTDMSALDMVRVIIDSILSSTSNYDGVIPDANTRWNAQEYLMSIPRLERMNFITHIIYQESRSRPEDMVMKPAEIDLLKEMGFVVLPVPPMKQLVSTEELNILKKFEGYDMQMTGREDKKSALLKKFIMKASEKALKEEEMKERNISKNPYDPEKLVEILRIIVHSMQTSMS